MANPLARAPNRPKDAEILLSSFTHVALQMDVQRSLLRSERGRSRRGKKGQKKQPQRGLGVAQLEKIRLEEQRAAIHEAQLLALHRHHGHRQAVFPHHAIAALEGENCGILPQPRYSKPPFVCFSSVEGSGAFDPACQRFDTPSNDVKAGVLEAGRPLPPSQSVGAWSRNGISQHEAYNREHLGMNSAEHSWNEGFYSGNPRYGRKTEYLGPSIHDHRKLPVLFQTESDIACSSSVHSVISLQHPNCIFQRQCSSNQAAAARLPAPSSLNGMMELSSFQSVCQDNTSSSHSTAAARRGELAMARIKRRACAIVPQRPSAPLTQAESGALTSFASSPGSDGTTDLAVGLKTRKERGGAGQDDDDDEEVEEEEEEDDGGLVGNELACALSLRPPGDSKLNKKRFLSEGGRKPLLRSSSSFLALGIPSFSYVAPDRFGGPPNEPPSPSPSNTDESTPSKFTANFLPFSCPPLFPSPILPRSVAPLDLTLKLGLPTLSVDSLNGNL